MKNAVFYINANKCILCYSCVRTCPVKAIEVKANSTFAKIIDSRCVNCGSCVPSCPTEAIVYTKSIEQADAILSKEKNAILLDPAIAAEFPDISDYRKFAQMLRQIGGKNIFDVSFGVDLMTIQYQQIIQNFKGKHYITSACPVINDMVSKYYPELLSNLITVLTPAQIMAKIARKIVGNDSEIIFITSCTASKSAYFKPEKEEHIDCVLTFEELRNIFLKHNISETQLEYSDFDGPQSRMGSLFPIANGWIELTDLDQSIVNSDIITIVDKNNSINALDEYSDKMNQIRKHLNMFYCKGCINGPGMTNPENILLKTNLVAEYTKKRANSISIKKWQDYIGEYSQIEMETSFEANDQRISVPEERVLETLAILKKEKSDYTKGCQVCGYKSCKDFAAYVAVGMAKSDMCLHNSLDHRNHYITSLQKKIEEMQRSHEEVKIEQEKTKKDKELAQQAMEILNAMLQKLPAAVVIVDNSLKIIRSNQSFINLLGKEALEISEIIPELSSADLKTLLPPSVLQYFSFVLENDDNISNKDIQFNEKLINISIFSIHKNKIVGAVLRDLYAPEIRDEEVINRLNEVIDKNLQMVQKIGFLLGEEVAATEQMLHSIIQSYKSNKK
ncbi:MAG TPA: [Fe-Fe] hydrogenase large subunit C-terminal domain-containing protein [Bacteroidales bacterium]|nr:[Fe-Fe] hydrogenase large subunit C-terminal domain-containing protein [Bacteroidales bacterium]